MAFFGLVTPHIKTLARKHFLIEPTRATRKRRFRRVEGRFSASRLRLHANEEAASQSGRLRFVRSIEPSAPGYAETPSPVGLVIV